jgi:hypothetical protein
MNVFLDTNIYLNFYHFTSDDLNELKKLFILQESKKLNVYITEQVYPFITIRTHFAFF